MDELVKLVSQKTGLPEDKSRLAVQTVLDYLKKKLPAPVASQIDTVLASGNVGNVETRSTQNFAMRSRGYITADARNQTEYGTVRSYIAVGLTGAPRSGTQTYA